MYHSRKLMLILIVAAALVPLAVVAQDQPVTLNVIGVTVPPEELGTPLDLAYQSLVSTVEEQNPNVDVNVMEVV